MAGVEVPEVERVQQNSCKLEDLLQVGLGALLQFEPDSTDSPRYKSVVRGWQDRKYILLDRPKGTEELESGGVYLQKDCVARFVTNDIAIGFRTPVLDVGFSRFHPQLSLLWPKEVMTVPTRKEVRVTVDVPCQVQTVAGATLESRLCNVGTQGCYLVVPDQVTNGSELLMNCALSEQHQLREVQVTVASCLCHEDRFGLRCKFVALRPEQDAILRSFVGVKSQGAAA